MKIKVQIANKVSTASLIDSWVGKMSLPLTFIAYSDTMKARVLESFLAGNDQVGLSLYDGPPRKGEWHEAFAANAVFNK